MIRLVIFDFGGVVHSLKGGSNLERAAKLYGVTVEELRPEFTGALSKLSTGEMNEFQFWQTLSKTINRPIPPEWRTFWADPMIEEKAYSEIMELVKELKARAVRTVVLSNTIPPHANICRERGWYKPFDKMYLSYEIGIRKPDRKAYELVLKDQDVKGAECVYVDDLEENLIPAGELGMKTILANNPKQVVDTIKRIMK